MKVTVDRLNLDSGELQFIITMSEPHVAPFSDEERVALESIDRFTKNMASTLDPTGDLYQKVLNANHHVKEQVFLKILQNLRFTIENEFRPKFQPICQEIYNWIYDNQEGFLKTWMMEFDPQRTTYYFDNDIKAKKSILNQESDQEDDWDDEDEDED